MSGAQNVDNDVHVHALRKGRLNAAEGAARLTMIVCDGLFIQAAHGANGDSGPKNRPIDEFTFKDLTAIAAQWIIQEDTAR